MTLSLTPVVTLLTRHSRSLRSSRAPGATLSLTPLVVSSRRLSGGLDAAFPIHNYYAPANRLRDAWLDASWLRPPWRAWRPGCGSGEEEAAETAQSRRDARLVMRTARTPLDELRDYFGETRARARHVTAPARQLLAEVKITSTLVLL